MRMTVGNITDLSGEDIARRGAGRAFSNVPAVGKSPAEDDRIKELEKRVEQLERLVAAFLGEPVKRQA